MWAKDDLGLATGLGFAHAMDRMLQMGIMRLVGQGRLSECLKSDAANLELDRFFRQLGFWRDAQEDATRLSKDIYEFANSYCSGINYCLVNHGFPWEFKLARYRPEPWQVSDVLLTVKLMSFIPFAQAQQDVEKLIIQSVKARVDLEKLKKLFSPHLDGMTEQIVELIKETEITQPSIPGGVRFLNSLPRFRASNNWVLSGARTASGKPIQCNDPHVECNRLPALWYEVIQHTVDNFRIGVTIPGVPGLIMGRNKELSFGFTYGFMDMLDYYIEDVQQEKCRCETGFDDLVVNTEIIKRKGKPPEKIKTWRSSHGLLEVTPGIGELPDGKYLARAWSGDKGDAAQSLSALYQMLKTKTVPELQQVLSCVTVSCNWLLADTQGNIGYQQSGRLPLRRHSGLHPVPGWDQRYDWQGFASSDQLGRITNPTTGYIATANHDLNQSGKPLSINMPSGSYRFERICHLLEQVEPATVDDMKTLQRDRHSLQAERFMSLIRPFIPDTEVGRILREWNYQYDKESRGAILFEEVYAELMMEVFGQGLFGKDAWSYIVKDTAIFADFYNIFDDVVLGADESWFGAAGRDGIIRKAIERVFARFTNPSDVPSWGAQHQFTMGHLFFHGKLARILGFEYGPIPLEGGRASIVQGAIYKSNGRTAALTQSLRWITDLATETAHTVIAGGPSDRRTSYYTSDVSRWRKYEYKVLNPSDS